MAERITIKHVQIALQRLVNVLAQRDPTARISNRYNEPGYRVERLYGARYRIQLRVIEQMPDGERMLESEPFGSSTYSARELYEAINFAIQVLYTERESLDRQHKMIVYSARVANTSNEATAIR